MNIPDLYFIPIIVKALGRPDRETALAEAFRMIRNIGEDGEFTRGWEQFEGFMAIVADSAASGGGLGGLPPSVANTIIELAFEAIELREDMAELARVLALNDFWAERYLAFREEWLNDQKILHPISLHVFKGGRAVQELVFEKTPGVASVTDIGPGRYEIELSTGRLLWAGDFFETDVILSHAFPEQPLDLAASTEEAEESPSREINLLDDEIVVRLYPGIEAGRMSVAVGAAGGNDA